MDLTLYWMFYLRYIIPNMFSSDLEYFSQLPSIVYLLRLRLQQIVHEQPVPVAVVCSGQRFYRTIRHLDRITRYRRRLSRAFTTWLDACLMVSRIARFSIVWFFDILRYLPVRDRETISDNIKHASKPVVNARKVRMVAATTATVPRNTVTMTNRSERPLGHDGYRWRLFVGDMPKVKTEQEIFDERWAA